MADLLTDKLLDDFCAFKHPGFAEEQEWRIVQRASADDQVKFDTSSGLIRPFLELWKGKKDRKGRKLPIREIVVGTAAPTVPSKRAVELLLGQFGYTGVDVVASAVPYRDL